VHANDIAAAAAPRNMSRYSIDSGKRSSASCGRLHHHWYLARRKNRLGLMSAVRHETMRATALRVSERRGHGRHCESDRCNGWNGCAGRRRNRDWHGNGRRRLMHGMRGTLRLQQRENRRFIRPEPNRVRRARARVCCRCECVGDIR
jgi:hypothetical protein